MNNDISIRDFQKLVDEWIKSTDAGYFDPLTNMAILTEETGEVARIIARKFGQQSCKPNDEISLETLANELADVVRVCCALANQCNIDLEDALMRKHDIICKRDAHRHIKK